MLGNGVSGGTEAAGTSKLSAAATPPLTPLHPSNITPPLTPLSVSGSDFPHQTDNAPTNTNNAPTNTDNAPTNTVPPLTPFQVPHRGISISDSYLQ